MVQKSKNFILRWNMVPGLFLIVKLDGEVHFFCSFWCYWLQASACELTVTSSLLAEAWSQWLSLFYQIKLICMIFFSFILSQWLHHYLFNNFATTFLHVLFCFSFAINNHAVFTRLTYGQILQELLLLKNIQRVAIINH